MAKVYLPNRSSATDLSYRHRTSLDGEKYTFEWYYMLRAACWTLTIYDAAGDVSLRNFPVRGGTDLLRNVKSVRNVPQGSINIEVPSTEQDVLAFNLGVSVLVSYDEVEA